MKFTSAERQRIANRYVSQNASHLDLILIVRVGVTGNRPPKISAVAYPRVSDPKKDQEMETYLSQINDLEVETRLKEHFLSPTDTSSRSLVVAHYAYLVKNQRHHTARYTWVEFATDRGEVELDTVDVVRN